METLSLEYSSARNSSSNFVFPYGLIGIRSVFSFIGIFLGFRKYLSYLHKPLSSQTPLQF